MNIWDMHIHAFGTAVDPSALIQSMEKAGVYGGCVFSNWPDRANGTLGTSFEERLNEVLAWVEGWENRLFPILWIHPYEENILDNIREACRRGVAGFKIICTDFYVNEPQCLTVLREIAKLNKPVFFHSGILWDGSVSSCYNRPLNWESLLEIDELRFSMGHCSWPWVDECIALYGKFMNALSVRKNSAEMFFDLTPGTPPIYRQELLTKLFTVGYDVENNLMFGTDTSAHAYNHTWAASWLNTDRQIMDTLGVSYIVRKKLYHENLLRFLGKTATTADHSTPLCDNSNAWCCQNTSVKTIIENRFKSLCFPKEYETEFRQALHSIPISDAISINTYDMNESDGKRNFLSFLYLCEELEKQYQSKGIDSHIFRDTLSDLKVWLDTWSELKGELYLGELDWLKRHFQMRLFKLGRLQFAFGNAEQSIPDKGIRQGEPVIEIHIPTGAPLTQEECLQSLHMAKNFFATHYPTYKYRFFTCHSWLLDPTLQSFLNPESNILQFQKLFEIVTAEESDAILKYVFRWDTKRAHLVHLNGTSELAKKVKKWALSGKPFYECTGILPKSVL